ncbi:hypothetical protein ACTHRY_00925 [Neisseria sp. P0004.S004]|jgi:hypothetical protein|uniref:hypothetical protein n=1 Tax=unclassified Neisseria TaxID=2623750 RepID=UPI00290F5DA7|nr:hypothetical protein [Neisseria mucosa]
MYFNRYVFDCYLQTDSARETKNFFENLSVWVKEEKWKEIYSYLFKQGYTQEIEGDWIETIQNLLEKFSDWERAENIEQAIEKFEGFVDSFLAESDKKECRNKLAWLDRISLFLYLKDPEHYIPYFFTNRFFLLERVFQSFDIPLPILPSKQKYRDRFLYYGNLCRDIYEFRKKYSLDYIELNCFLYDFSLKTLPDFINADELPDAINIYISGGTKEDTDLLTKNGEKYQTFWQGNPQTKIGDIILLYSLSPYSGLTAIFRAVSPTYYDPFSNYPERVWVGCPIVIQTIHLSELKNNPVWKEKGLVKANMQGVNGRECTSDEYNAIIEILKSKNFDVSILPKLPFLDEPDFGNLSNERDVEITLLEPLLKQLGFDEDDWLRQMTLRMGRNDRVFPDYALFANDRRGEESARFIWEAKYRIANERQLKDAFLQAKSYALRLGCDGFGLVALEGVWISTRQDDFKWERLHKFSWSSLKQKENFSRLRKFFKIDRIGR